MTVRTSILHELMVEVQQLIGVIFSMVPLSLFTAASRLACELTAVQSQCCGACEEVAFLAGINQLSVVLCALVRRHSHSSVSSQFLSRFLCFRCRLCSCTLYLSVSLVYCCPACTHGVQSQWLFKRIFTSVAFFDFVCRIHFCCSFGVSLMAKSKMRANCKFLGAIYMQKTDEYY